MSSNLLAIWVSRCPWRGRSAPGAFLQAVLVTSLVTLSAGAEQERPFTVVGVKVMKTDPHRKEEPFRVQLPGECTECAVLGGSAYRGQNPREVFFHLRVPVSQPSIRNVKVDVGGIGIRSVIVEKNRILFSSQTGSVTFDVPVVPRARSSTIEMQTFLEWPGIVLRVEHAFEDRRAGKYATGPWPAVQAQAALNLEFGLREAVRTLGLDQEVEEKGLGKIHLMGFDTNYPLGHEDYPPHIHLILRWPHFAGSQAPHFYLSDKGLLLQEVIVTIDGMPHIASTRLPRGAALPVMNYLGDTIFETQVTDEGGLALRLPNSKACTLRPLMSGEAGFARGALVSCSTGEVFTVQADDDTNQGEVRVLINSRPPEIYKYDPDTAVLLSVQSSLPKLRSSATR